MILVTLPHLIARRMGLGAPHYQAPRRETHVGPATAMSAYHLIATG
jgi:hypothetical protein